jgi:hypothetical protein
MSGPSSPARIATINVGGTATQLALSLKREQAIGGPV